MTRSAYMRELLGRLAQARTAEALGEILEGANRRLRELAYRPSARRAFFDDLFERALFHPASSLNADIGHTIVAHFLAQDHPPLHRPFPVMDPPEGAQGPGRAAPLTRADYIN